jgi:hypothetical protein
VDALLFRVIYCWGTIGARETMDFDNSHVSILVPVSPLVRDLNGLYG